MEPNVWKFVSIVIPEEPCTDTECATGPKECYLDLGTAGGSRGAPSVREVHPSGPALFQDCVTSCGTCLNSGGLPCDERSECPAATREDYYKYFTVVEGDCVIDTDGCLTSVFYYDASYSTVWSHPP